MSRHTRILCLEARFRLVNERIVYHFYTRCIIEMLCGGKGGNEVKRYKWIKLLKSAKEMLLLCHRFQIHTSLPKKRVFRWIELFVREHYDDYRGWLEDDGFTICVKKGRNTVAPDLEAKIVETEDGSVIDVILTARKHDRIGMILLQCFALCGSFVYYPTFCLYLIFVLINFISVFLPARKLKERLVSYFEQETVKPKKHKEVL